MAPCLGQRPHGFTDSWMYIKNNHAMGCNDKVPYQVQEDDSSSKDLTAAVFTIDQDDQASNLPHTQKGDGCLSSDETNDIISERERLALAPRAMARIDNFPESEVQQWEVGRFKKVKELQDATRNFGKVILMREASSGSHYAVKCLPNHWMRNSEAEFLAAHPGETEKPWKDLATLRHLERHSFPYLCTLHGVFRNENFTFVAMKFATEGDLFSWCEKAVAPGPEREIAAQSLIRQVVHGVQLLHNLGIVHGDLSLENTLVTQGENNDLRVNIIDFGASSTKRFLSTSTDGFMGKVSYQAPEIHTGHFYDGFLADAFALGVLAFSTVMSDYPWLSTIPDGCKCFTYFQDHGFNAYMRKRKVRGGTKRFQEVMSQPLQQLLSGLLELDPSSRVTLGEDVFATTGRRTAWQEPWLKGDSTLSL
mmetsp:Transcript_41640/g.75568  ORF Transcript_41640/g.75568 Transcript_41640/m.75568 type:complete len:421 (-) Transcript_41640:62-1324(-)